MNLDMFYHVALTVLKKKYPWINDIVVTHTYDDFGRSVYGLKVQADSKFKEEEVFLDKYEDPIERDVKGIFNMLEPFNERFDRVIIK